MERVDPRKSGKYRDIPPPAEKAGTSPPRLTLLGGFALRLSNGDQRIGLAGQRLLALLAVEDRSWTREAVADKLWPDHPEARARSNLRSALWRLPDEARHHLQNPHRADLLTLHEIEVDLRQLINAAAGLLESPSAESSGLTIDRLDQELLPGWVEEWLAPVRERLRQLRLHALETLCAQHSKAGRHSEAVRAGVAAVRLEPLRESAHVALIRAHLLAGNRPEAVEQYKTVEALLYTELGIAPCEQTRALIAGGFTAHQERTTLA